MNYSEACDRAATDQGLDPICEALRAAGIPHHVDQTGGFCMAVNIPLREGGAHYLYMTDAQDHSGGPAGWAAVGEYWECETLYGTEWHGEGLLEWRMDQILGNDFPRSVTPEQQAQLDVLYAATSHPTEELAEVVREAARAQRECPYCNPPTRETLVA